MSTEPTSTHQITIRLANLGDSEQISILCEQLGYSAISEDIKQRLCSLQQNQEHIVYVACLTNGYVVAWLHAHQCHLIITPPTVLVLGLVVDEQYRGCGIGYLLMQQVEQWAIANNFYTVLVRSNVIRKDAHYFYEKIGYTNIKQSLVFCKNLM